MDVAQEGPDVGEVASIMEEDTGSPMQQSPDQSNIYDSYRFSDTSFSEEMNIDIKQDKTNKQDLEELNKENVEGLCYGFSSTNKVEMEDGEINEEFSKDNIGNLKNEEQMNGIVNEADGFEEFNYNAQSYQTDDLNESCNKKVISSSLQNDYTINLEQSTGSEGFAAYSSAYNNKISESGMIEQEEQEEVTSTSNITFKITDNKSATTFSNDNTCHTITDTECNSQIIVNTNTVSANEKDTDDELGETSKAKHSDYEDNDELDLTKYNEDSRKEDDYNEIEADSIVCQKTSAIPQQDIDYNVSSSTNIVNDKITAEESERLECTPSDEDHFKSSGRDLPQDNEDEENRSAASLEEVSDGEINESERSGVEEVSSDEEESECSEESGAESIGAESIDDGSAEKIQSGIEEVSDEEEVDEGEEKQNNHEVEKPEEKSESGMEDVSDEEGELEDESGVEEESEESGRKVDKPISNKENDNRRKTEYGVENVSSEEDEQCCDFDDYNSGKQDKKDVSFDKHDENDTSENQHMKKVQTVSNTKIDGETVVREILQNLIDKIKYNSNSEHKLRKKSTKDKNDQRESMKLKSKSCPAKDTRDINERLKSQASYGDDVELDYDDIHDEAKDRQGSESEGEILSGSESSDGELEDEEDCEEGEIREPGQKPFLKPTCRFFMRGHCTWGINCRFLHPGVNDKGYYQLIERPGFNNKPPITVEDKWEVEQRSPSPEPPPPPAPEPKEETAWERGLRQAKELRKKAMERRELEPNFEHKKMNLSIEDNPEYDKENTMEKVVIKEKSPMKKQTYYDKYESLSDDEYYDQTPIRLHQKQQLEQAWLPGHYENFEVRWAHDRYMPLPPLRFTPEGRFPSYHPEEAIGGQERFLRKPSPRRFSPSPPLCQHPGDDDLRYARQPSVRDPRVMHPEKFQERPMSPSPQKFRPQSPSKQKADEWHDPWRRSNVNKSKSPKKRSHSRGRRRSRHSYSYSTSYSSSTYSSRSRSSSSSVSSRSHSSRSSSVSNRSVSPPGITPMRAPQKQRPVPAAGNQQLPPPRPARVSERPRPSDPHRSVVAAAPMRPGRSPPVKPPGAVLPPSPSKAAKGARRGPTNAGPGRGPTNAGPIGQLVPDVGRKPLKSAAPVSQPVERKFKMEVKTRDRLLPQVALNKEVPKPRPRGRKASSSTSRSRSRSVLRSSSSSSRTSYSSRSSRSYSRSSSSSSSGSADSDHLYRDIGSRENPKQALPPPLPRAALPPLPKGKPTEKIRHAHPADVRAPGPPTRLLTKPIIGETSRPVSAIQAQVIKDPLKVTGQKSNIKLTLIKPSDKPPAVPPSQEPHIRKRPAEPTNEGPPPKRPAVVSSPTKIADKPVKRLEKPPLVSPTKVQPRASVPNPARPIIGAPVVPTVTIKKKSTVSRREELLKQLKAVEDAIAKKKKKIG